MGSLVEGKFVVETTRKVLSKTCFLVFETTTYTCIQYMCYNCSIPFVKPLLSQMVVFVGEDKKGWISVSGLQSSFQVKIHFAFSLRKQGPGV